MLTPAHALLALFLFLPSLYVGWLSLTDATLGKTASFVGLANYARLLADPAFWSAFWNTFVVVNVIVYGELLLGLGVALLVRRGRAVAATDARDRDRALRDERGGHGRDVEDDVRSRRGHRQLRA